MSFKKLKKQTSIYREKIGMAIIVLEQAISNIIKSIETSSKVCRGRLARPSVTAPVQGTGLSNQQLQPAAT